MTEVRQQGSSLRDDRDARLRRELAEAFHRAVLNNELQSCRTGAQRIVLEGSRQQTGTVLDRMCDFKR